jgi:aryl-alcohol dehydrogenase-like predicted oxidoreductase
VPGHTGGESETIIGNWLKRSGKRDKVVIATKSSVIRGGERWAPDRVVASLDHYCPEFSERTASKYLTYNGFSAILGGVDLK